MSQHSQRTQYGPSVGTIVTGVVLTMGGGTAVAYVLSGPLTARGIVGALLGASFTVLMGLGTLERAVERRVALDRIERQAERQEAARREDALRAEWERAVYGTGPDPEPVPPLNPEEPDWPRDALPDEWDRWDQTVWDAAQEPDPVATQPLPEEPDPLRVEHWATGGADPARSAVEAPERYGPPRYSGPLYPPVEEPREPARYPFHPRPVDQPDWADRDWPTEVMFPRQS